MKVKNNKIILMLKSILNYKSFLNIIQQYKIKIPNLKMIITQNNKKKISKQKIKNNKILNIEKYFVILFYFFNSLF